MYSDWSSLQLDIETESKNLSVLNKFPGSVAKDVASCVVKSLSQSLNLTISNNEPSNLTTAYEVRWTMEVLSFGLSLPLSDMDTIKDCVTVYCEWLSTMTNPKIVVPRPVVEEPNPFTQQMLIHLRKVFVPRAETGTSVLPGHGHHGHKSTTPTSEGNDPVSKQALLCHRILRTIQDITEHSTLLDGDTWEAILKFLLAVTDTLLASPIVTGDIGSQLSERVLKALFEIWINACYKCFPSPPLWKTLREMCCTWRHHELLITQWQHVSAAFTSRVLKVMYGDGYPTLYIGRTSDYSLPSSMDNDTAVQCWFRFLHIIGNPVELSRPQDIANTVKFKQCSAVLISKIKPHEHECLRGLPLIFLKAMTTASMLVDAFLGLNNEAGLRRETLESSVSLSLSKTPGSPHAQRKTRAFSTVQKTAPPKPAASHRTSVTQLASGPVMAALSPTLIPLQTQQVLATTRPSVNSILHLFGAWLVEAAMTGVKHDSVIVFTDKSSLQFEAGKAEALGTLCRLLCSKKTGETIAEVYLARCYIALYYGLSPEQSLTGGLVLTNILFNSCNLLRVNLQGVQVLLPRIIQALELILPDLTPKFKYDEQRPYCELRRAAIHMLLSCLCLPLQMQNLTIEALTESDPSPTFLSLKSALTELLFKALMVETDVTNIEMLLGGLLLCVQDLALYANLGESTSSDSKDATPAEHTDAASSLFDRTVNLVCFKLKNSNFTQELNIALAALEVLSGLARVRLPQPNPMTCKRTVNWICGLIEDRSSRPARDHSKDMHSILVSAYQCITTWVVEHEDLMKDKECLQCVVGVIELGISGTKSQNKVSDVPKLKADKENKPVSMRVKEAAEGLLSVLMDCVGSFPPPCGPESMCSLLDEESLVRYAKNLTTGQPNFSYYALDENIIVALLESPDGQSAKDGLPTVTAIVRGPFGRHTWTMQLRHYPRCKAPPLAGDPIPRPAPQNDVGTKHCVKHRFFPESIESVPVVKADQSIPVLEETMASKQSLLTKMDSLIQQQVVYEKNIMQKVKDERDKVKVPDRKTECKAPSACKSFQTARLFLSHYGFLTLNALQEENMEKSSNSVACLHPAKANFKKALESLDSISSRNYDTVHVFYVRAGQRKASDILENVSRRSSVNPIFLEVLRSLGWPVDVAKHAGWTGHVATSWRIQPSTAETEDEQVPDSGGAVYDGRQQVLYWADVAGEVAFVVPSIHTWQQHMTSSMSDSHSASTISLLHQPLLSQKPKSLSLDLDKPPTDKAQDTVRLKSQGRSIYSSCSQSTKVFVVWLENFEDHTAFPTMDLVPITDTGDGHITGKAPYIYVIFLHPLKNGLLRVRINGPNGRIHTAVPLVDGMLVSRRTVGILTRQTASNICKRRRLEDDGYHPPHANRKLRIRDIVEKYRSHLTEPEFYTELYS